MGKTVVKNKLKTSSWLTILILVLVCILMAGLVYLWRNNLATLGTFPWLAVASLLPAVLVLNHGIYLQWQPRSLSLSSSGEKDLDGMKLSQLQRLFDQEYRGYAIAISYYIPTFALAVAGFVSALMVFDPQSALGNIEKLIRIASEDGTLLLSDSLIEGIRFGTLGAYVYVLMTIAERTFRRDISPGLAQWSASQLILGPILGGVAAATLANGTSLSLFTQQILFFVAGMAPRQFVAVAADTATRFWSKGETPVVNSVSLRLIGGITARVEERLFEEGIEDAHQLAMANPVRLNRDTPYELRQITNWIDQAILYSTVPENAPLLQKEGVTGAMDLASYAKTQAAIITAPSGNEKTRLQQLAEAVHMTAETLKDVVLRLSQDQQVILVRGLYQSDQFNDDNGSWTS